MAKKKRRDCLECIAYYNLLGEGNYQCGLGFEVEETAEGGYGTWSVVVGPYENACEVIPQPKTKEEFIKAAAESGIEWELDEVLDVGECDIF